MHPCRLADIAKKTGYSIATVSRVLSSSSSRISPETRREVLNAARSLGYRKETRNIAILIGDYGFPSYFGYILQPLCYELRKRAFVRSFSMRKTFIFWRNSPSAPPFRSWRKTSWRSTGTIAIPCR